MDGLRDWWADKIDQSFFNVLTGFGVTTAVNIGLTGMQAPTAATSAAANTRILYGSGSTSTTASYTQTSSASASAKGLHFTPAVIDLAVNVAKTATPLIRPVRVDGQYKYVMFIHPNQTRQLRTNNAANTVTWYDIMRARAEGGDLANNPIYNGAYSLGHHASVTVH